MGLVIATLGDALYLFLLGIFPIISSLELGNASVAIGLNLRNAYKGNPLRLLGHSAYLALPLTFSCIWVAILFSTSLIIFVLGFTCVLVCLGFGISLVIKPRAKVDPWWIMKFFDNFPGGF